MSSSQQHHPQRLLAALVTVTDGVVLTTPLEYGWWSLSDSWGTLVQKGALLLAALLGWWGPRTMCSRQIERAAVFAGDSYPARDAFGEMGPRNGYLWDA